MSTLEALVYHLATDADLRAAFAADPEATLSTRGLALTDAEREVVRHLYPLLALPAEALLQRLLDDDPAAPWRWWDTPPIPAQATR